MNRHRFLIPRVAALALSAAALTVSTLSADDLDDSEQSGWFVRLGGRVSSGMKASVRDTRPVAAVTPGVYGDGYVLPSGGGNPSLTYNWGYQSGGQVQDGGEGGSRSLVFQRLDDAPRVGDRSGLKDDPQFGGELVAGFEFFRFEIGKREARFGFEAGYSYSQLSVTDHAVATGTASYTVDRFALDAASPGNPITPPLPPYSGSADTPGPLIGLIPSAHTVVTTTGTDTLDTKLDCEFHNFRIGPWVEIPLSGRVSLGISAGYATIYSSSHLSLTETVSFADPTVPAPAPLGGRYLGAHWSSGAYAQIRATYHLTKRLGVYVGGDVQYSTGANVAAPGREARIDFGTTYGGVAGLSFGF